jgi:hypothetical protein
VEAAERGRKREAGGRAQGSLYPTQSSSVARQLAEFRREIAVDLVAFFEREMRDKGEESEGK